ncbi:iron-sulfur cluster biosynthesis family protein [Salimicrobium flavidum]|uniref:Fe-S cluster assembly iron-binding protein IscA n=1 Tax=Salimicrobium flavidum TaxID=570947 RepID=A0A1N7IRK8_9BACI|nr:iron-sulfur cluster biosynthesis family protein [Salimicrobium flavidum]SIS39745.1 Fe-S cluster assembly iron-binding protein IscA [Salimicrobium flavidum]
MKITDQAKEVLTTVLKEEQKEGLRLFSQGEGCCGPQLGLALGEAEPADKLEESNGIAVAIDPEVSSEVEGLTLDREDSEEGTRLVLLGMDECC